MKRILSILMLMFAAYLVYANDYPSLIRPIKSIQIVPQKVMDSGLVGLNHAVSVQEIEVDINALFNSDNVSLTIGGEDIIMDRINVVKNEAEDYIYCAYESNDMEISLSKLGNNIQGVINSALYGSYIIETINDSYILAQLDPDEIDIEGAPLEYNDDNMTLAETVSNELSSTDSNDIKYVRVLVMYTPEALSLASDMTNKVYLDINNGNTSFQNSNVNVRFELAYVGQTDDNEDSYTFHQLLGKYRTNGDGFADEVHTLRERYSADVCVLLIATGGYCGLGYLNSSKTTAFVAVNAGSGCANKYTFAHEIGHNAGCDHDTLVSPTSYPYQYAHGYVNYTGATGSSWRTMMAYGDACGGELYCQRVKYWSNPDVDFNGTPTGDPIWSNNARVWNENATRVSSFNADPSSITITSADNSTYMDYAYWHATQNIYASNYTVESGQTVEMLASSSITLLPGTTIKSGAKFRASVRQTAYNNLYPQYAPKDLKSNCEATEDGEQYDHAIHVYGNHSPQKIINEGKLIILREGEVYTITGQKIK